MTPSHDRKPDDDEIDVYGLTPPGKGRPDNQDPFPLAPPPSLAEAQRAPFGPERLAFIAMVADGVGGGVGGAEASATTLEVATEYILGSMACYDRKDAGGGDFINALAE